MLLLLKIYIYGYDLFRFIVKMSNLALTVTNSIKLINIEYPSLESLSSSKQRGMFEMTMF